MIRLAAFLLLLASLLAAAPVCAPVWAMETAPVATARTTATLLTDVDSVRPGQPMHLALRLRMAPGWHTYWQNPGDAGAAPELVLTLPPGATSSSVAWPVPVRQPEGPIMTYGYSGDLILPLAVTPGDGPLAIQAEATWLVCEKLCVPEQASFKLELPQGPATPSPQAPLIAAALAAMPHQAAFEAAWSPDGTLVLHGPALPAGVTDAWFLPAAAGLAAQPDAPSTIAPGRIEIPLRRGPDLRDGDLLPGIVVLARPTGQQAFTLAATPGAPPLAPTMPAQSIVRPLLLALLGGLLLNLMPCVFPVLAMKAVALARLSGQDRRAVRAQSLAYVAGVLLAFAVLGGILLALRRAGAGAGWGFQFQSPAFVGAACWVLFAVGLNLSGVFRLGTAWAGAGQGLAARPGLSGSFFTGLLAVVVASPCTAPFMGTAMAAASLAPPPAAFAILLAVGAGLAAPYALFAAAPGLARMLPRPGRWMEILKGVLAFPMYAAAAWLLWVVSLQAGPPGVLAVTAGLVLVGLAAWAAGLSGAARPAWRLLPILPVLAAAALLPGLAAAPPPEPAQQADGAEPFSPQRLDTLRAEGRPVFVNMTAAWCVSCLVNERLALSPDPVRRAFAAHRVAILKGDWTRADPAITAFLRDYGSDGVPLYVLYPAKGTPTVLPQILTQSDILARLEALGG